MKSDVDSFLDPAGVPVRISINYKLNLVPKRIMVGLVGVLRNGRVLGMGESFATVTLFDSLLHRSPCFPDVDFAALTGNLVKHATLFSRIDRVLRTHQVSPKCRVGFEDGANAFHGLMKTNSKQSKRHDLQL